MRSMRAVCAVAFEAVLRGCFWSIKLIDRDAWTRGVSPNDPPLRIERGKDPLTGRAGVA